MRHAPDVSKSKIESACRSAGQYPEDDPERRPRLRQIARLFTAEISDADLKVIADFVRGAFDRKPGDGRPANLRQRAGLDTVARRARAIHREHGCSLKTAIVRALRQYGKEPDERTITYVRNYINRG